MYHSPNPAAENLQRDNTPYKHTEPILLDRRQWSYVQRRYSLTPRERQIAELICRGLRNGSIAGSLRITPGTVKTHTRNIYRKVRVKSKIAMLLRFVAESRLLSTQYEAIHSIPIAD